MTLEIPSVTNSSHQHSFSLGQHQTGMRNGWTVSAYRKAKAFTIPPFLLICTDGTAQTFDLIGGHWCLTGMPLLHWANVLCIVNMTSCFISRYQTGTLNSKSIIMNLKMTLCHTKSILFQCYYGFFKSGITYTWSLVLLHFTALFSSWSSSFLSYWDKKKWVYRWSVVIHVVRSISREPSEECEV